MNTLRKSEAPFSDEDFAFMGRALELARTAAAQHEVPVGAVLVADGKILGEGMNAPIAENDPSAHAEMTAIRAAARAVGNYRLPRTTLYVTLEPCAMCAGAIVWARIDRVVFSLGDPRAGAAGSVLSVIPNPALNHRPIVESGLFENESRALIQSFFSKIRNPKSKIENQKS